MTSPAETAMRKARTALVLQHPFFGALALKLRLEECATIETADVDGVTLRFNPAYTDKLSVAERIGLWGHEVMHCAMGHVWRRGARDGNAWNWACDYAVDPIIQSAGLTVPDATINPAWQGWSAEAIYPHVPKGGDGAGAPKRKSFGEMRDPQPGPGHAAGTPADMAAAEQEWKVAAIQAAHAAKAAGNLPGALKAMIEDIHAPRLDWRLLLRKFMTARTNSDYRWSPPNRRYLHYGLYLPSLRSEGVGRIAVMIDTSGSVSAAELAAFQAELNAILEDVRPEAVHLIQCDARVNDTAEYRPEDLPLRLTFKGRGGTDFRPPFAWLEREGISPVAAIYLTDLEGPFPAAAPDYPVMWVSTGANHAPWGDVIKLSMEDAR